MLKRPSHFSNSELFEELNEQDCEKISGGMSELTGPLFTDLLGNISIIPLLNPAIQERINAQIEALGISPSTASTSALACVTENGQLVCEVSADGSQPQSFTIPLP